ncbi:hypothetical protein BH11VER1_BH11VER1_27600 [soil metagenome]
MRPCPHLSALFSLLLLLGIIEARAQTATESPAAAASAPVPSTVSKLEQLESTYLFSLRKFHGPVLLDYQRDLERLKQQLIARSRPDDAKYVEAEIEYIKTLSTTTGVLPYTALIPPPPASVQPSPAADTAPGPLRRNKMPTAALSLNATEASKTSLPLNAKTEGLPLGAIEWPVSKLPAGNYDIVMLYACTALDKPEKIALTFAGKNFNATLPVDRVTASDTLYHPYRLAKVMLEQDVANSTLSIQSESPASPHLFVKGVFFIKRD